MELLQKLFPTILINIHCKKVENSFFQNTLSEKCRYSEFFWSVFSRIRTEYEQILRISPYSIRIQENGDQKISEYGHFSRSASLKDRMTYFNIFVSEKHFRDNNNKQRKWTFV